MFEKLKEKLKGWIKGSSEKIEDEAEVVAPVDVPSEGKTEGEVKEKLVKKSKKNVSKKKETKESKKKESLSLAEKTQESSVPQKVKLSEEKKDLREKETKNEISKKDSVEILSEKSVEDVVDILAPEDVPSEGKEKGSAKESSERLRDLTPEGVPFKGKEEEIEKVDKLIEDAKRQDVEDIPVKFEVGKQKYEPDVDEIKEGEVDGEIEAESEAHPSVQEGGESVEDEESKNDGFFSRLKSKLSYKIGLEEFDEIFDDLEMILLENNVALEAIEDLRKRLSEKLIGKEISKSELEEEIKKELKEALNELLIEPDNPLDVVKEKNENPFVILFFGINGAGKTTSIAKIAHFLKASGMSVVLAAGDTFRAASIEQISEHAKRLGVPLIKHDYESDPAAVGFDAIKYAKAHGIDVVLIDTAGRMHTKANLMSEMEKICRVTNPDLKIFVAESIAGNDAVEQARAFQNAIGIDGTILSKADVDEKGGTVISVSHATGKPIFYLGVGQGYDDLRLFNKQEFIESLGL